ncbi:MAG: hypothetical protein HY852_25445 [Bradyrhizobium sp.]|uniref:hypothetical protein n=1 Tax=Bradyrhizobium sp. TaxID=376 RepID=UPI0025BBCDD8|nr:hypothetical protein [Bradyrhizobium sp.]MBI5265153.1 hypothetical protein [Bradyrhizobium sp.]
MTRVIVEHRRPPSAFAFMARAFLRSPRLPKQPELPDLVERWTGVRIGGEHEARFREATGREAGCVLYPHVLGFRLQLAVLTHPAFPLPLWNALQIRNRLVRHLPLDRNAEYAFETSIGGRRVVEKGLEVDLHTRLSPGGDCDWESVVTYFYRGRFDQPSAPVTPPASPDLSAASTVAAFRTPKSGGLAFGGLTGDYNGIHLWSPYARGFGFKSAFMHPQRAVGLCLAHLEIPEREAGALALWIKGPIFYDTDVILSAVQEPDNMHFGLSLAGDPRHAIVGSWSAAAP